MHCVRIGYPSSKREAYQPPVNLNHTSWINIKKVYILVVVQNEGSTDQASVKWKTI